MQKKSVILLLIFIVVVGACILFLYPRLTREQGVGNVKNEIEIVPGSGDNLDQLETKSQGRVSLVKNATHDYSITVPNSWKIETQPGSLKLYPKDESGVVDACLLTTTAFDSNGMSPEDLINQNIEYAVDEVRNSGPVSVQQYDGLLQTELENGQIVGETVYIEVDTKIYTLSSFYGHIHGREEEADYAVCHPLFENLLDTFSIN